ncbi:MAG: PAS domain S-box protein [Gemmatimonadota bacterium]
MDTRRIVIVARDVASQQQLGRSIVHLGYSIAGTAVSCEEAMAAIAVADLVLCDTSRDVMPDAAERAALRQHAGIPVVFLGAHGPTWAAADSASVTHGVLTRPFSPRELQCTIELAFSRGETTRAVDAAEQRFFDVSIDLLCYLDYSGYFRRLNPAWEHTLGFARAEMMDRPFIDFVHPDDRERTLAQNKAVRQGGRALSFENRYRCKDGGYRWLRWNAAPDAAHRTIYSVARDVTAAKEAEAEREALVVKLQAALAEVQTLQGIMPICSYCRKVRDDENYWHSVESYLARHTRTRLSHGICPSCMDNEMEPLLRAMEDDASGRS